MYSRRIGFSEVKNMYPNFNQKRYEQLGKLKCWLPKEWNEFCDLKDSLNVFLKSGMGDFKIYEN